MLCCLPAHWLLMRMAMPAHLVCCWGPGGCRLGLLDPLVCRRPKPDHHPHNACAARRRGSGQAEGRRMRRRSACPAAAVFVKHCISPAHPRIPYPRQTSMPCSTAWRPTSLPLPRSWGAPQWSSSTPRWRPSGACVPGWLGVDWVCACGCAATPPWPGLRRPWAWPAPPSCRRRDALNKFFWNNETGQVGP